MLRFTPGIVVLALFTIATLGACGDSEETPETTLDDGMTLAELDSQQQELLCDAIVADSPAECWQESNYPSGSFKLKSDAVEFDVAVCLDTLPDLEPTATVAEVKACFAEQDEACELTGSACEIVVPANYW